MDSPQTKLPGVFLQPGQMYLAETPTIITTILGSCVGVTMFNRRLKIAALCHSPFPICEAEEATCGCERDKCFKYVNCSITQMLASFEKYGVKPKEIEVKIFGGSSIIGNNQEGRKKPIGEQNVEAAMQIVRVHNLNMTAVDVGGLLGRKIHFNTRTGEVLLKRIQKTEVSGLI